MAVYLFESLNNVPTSSRGLLKTFHVFTALIPFKTSKFRSVDVTEEKSASYDLVLKCVTLEEIFNLNVLLRKIRKLKDFNLRKKQAGTLSDAGFFGYWFFNLKKVKECL